MTNNIYFKQTLLNRNQTITHPTYYKPQNVRNNKIHKSGIPDILNNYKLQLNYNTREFGRDLTNICPLDPNKNSIILNEKKIQNDLGKDQNYNKSKKDIDNLKKALKRDNYKFLINPLNLKCKKPVKSTSNNNSFCSNKENINILNTKTIFENEESAKNNNSVRIEMDIETNNDLSVKEIKETISENILFKNNINLPSLQISKSNDDHFILKNPQEVSEYLEDIKQHLKETEYQFIPKYDYMNTQTDINENMRAILIDWIVDVHLKFKLVPETLFLTTQIIDRYLEKKDINRNKLQLVGVTSLFIASKYEDIYPPGLKDFVYITDKAYTKTDILQMEKEILNILEFNVTAPTAFRFLEIFFISSLTKFDHCNFLFANYLLELFLTEYKMVKYPPSCIAAATLFITIKTKQLNVKANIDIEKVTGYSEDKLKQCAKDMCFILDNINKSNLKAVRSKYSSKIFLEVAK